MSLKPEAFSIAAAAAAAVMDIFGFFWHGMMSQPSVMNILYPGFWMNPLALLAGLAGTVVGAYVMGWIFAVVYNKYEKRR
jgi:hypothetical protein